VKLKQSGRDRGHYLFHTLFRDTIERGGLFHNLPARHPTPEHPGNGALEIIRNLLVFINTVHAAILEGIPGNILCGPGIDVLLGSERNVSPRGGVVRPGSAAT
jgi:hypothetical protein